MGRDRALPPPHLPLRGFTRADTVIPSHVILAVPNSTYDTSHTIPYYIISCHTTQQRTKSYHIVPHDTTTNQTIPYRVIPYHTATYHTIPYRTIPYPTTPHHTLDYTISSYTTPQQTKPYHIVLYHTIPYHTKPCHIVLYHVPHHTTHTSRRTKGANNFGRVSVQYACAYWSLWWRFQFSNSSFTAATD